MRQAGDARAAEEGALPPRDEIAARFLADETDVVAGLAEDKGAGPAAILKRLVARSGEPFIRQALRQAMKILGDNFVLGRSIKEALSRAATYEARGYRFSYDMLGERAKTDADADRYFDRYMAAIEAIGDAKGPGSGDFR